MNMTFNWTFLSDDSFIKSFFLSCVHIPSHPLLKSLSGETATNGDEVLGGSDGRPLRTAAA